LRQFLAYPPPQLASTPQPVPALLLYLLNIFSKCVIAQFVGEAGVSTKSADPVGILVAQVFSSPDFKYQRQFTMIDILLAKFRFVCPVLWGMYGDEKTVAGKKRIGWMSSNGHFVLEQRHGERMTGLGAGFAAIGLRNFERSKDPNPFPNSNYWRSFADIINVPPKEIQPTHFIVLKAMIEGQEEKILTFFGDAGLMALRMALVEFPASAPEQSAACRAVALLPEILAKDKNIQL
jgi:nucleoporin GLE1